MLGNEIILESAVDELVKDLPSLEKHDYDTIDKLMRKIAKKHHITGKALHDIFVKKFKKAPDDWFKNKLDETGGETEIRQEVDKFAQWTMRKLNMKGDIKIELGFDSEEAQDGHHTGKHVPGSGTIWVYANNRNLVDILRTVAHELTHVKQHEIREISPGESYPGSPIEMLADMVAGKLIKIYGKKNRQIFQ